DQPFGARRAVGLAGKRPNVYLSRAGLSRSVRYPSSVRRNMRLPLVELSGEHGEGLSSSRRSQRIRQRPDIVGVLRIDNEVQQDEAAVARPARRDPSLIAKRAFLARAVGRLDIQLRLASAIGRKHDELAIGRPDWIVVVGWIESEAR